MNSTECYVAVIASFVVMCLLLHSVIMNSSHKHEISERFDFSNLKIFKMKTEEQQANKYKVREMQRVNSALITLRSVI